MVVFGRQDIHSRHECKSIRLEAVLNYLNNFFIALLGCDFIRAFRQKNSIMPSKPFFVSLENS